MAAQTPPLPIDQIDLEKVTVRKPNSKSGSKPNQHGLFYNVQYNNGPLRFFSPEMIMPFGAKLSELNNKVRGAVTFDDSKSETKRFREFIKRLEERLQRAIVEAGPNMYPKDKSYSKTPPEKIKQRFKGIIKSGTDEDGNPYPDRIDLVFPRSKNDPNKFKAIESTPPKPFLVDKKDKEIPITVDTVGDVLPRGTRIRGVIEASYVFAKHLTPFDTTISFNLVHAMLSATQEKPSWSLRNENDSDSDESNDADSTAAVHGDTSASTEDVEYQEVTDSEGESVDEESPASA